jgi:hypothetical protein
MLLVLCVVLLGTAFGANSAQAAKWLTLTSGGVAKTGEELKAAIASQLESSHITLHVEILKTKLLILCSGFIIIRVNLEGSGKLTEGGKLKLTGCIVEINGSPNANCAIKSGGEPTGTILTNEVKGALVLNEGVGLIRIEPKEAGKPFVTFELPETCPVGEKIPLNGILYLKDAEGKLETHLVKHLVEESKPSELWMTNTNNTEHKVACLFSLWIFLEGEHTGLAWDGMPE